MEWVYVLVFGGILYVLLMYGNIVGLVAIGFVVLAILVLVIQAIVDHCELKNIDYTVLLGRTRVMTTKTRPSGFSIGSKGHMRTYWRFREEVDHVDVDFEVHYQDGRVCQVTAREGSGKCDKLHSYIGKPKEKPKVIEQPQIAEAPKIVETPKIVEVPKEKYEQPRRNDRKMYYIDIPFEIAPNEYGLKISYPSCQVEKKEDGDQRVYVRFTATYDPTVKGLRNRVIICSIVNKDGKTMDISRGRKVLDTSGSQMVDITYWHLMDEEPARVVVGLDRYN